MTDPQTAADLDALATEGRLPAAANLDELPTRAQIALLAEQDAVAIAAVAAAGDQIAAAVEAIAARLEAGGRLIYVGAGTSGGLARLDAGECAPTFGVAPDRVVALVAGRTGADADGTGPHSEAAEDDADAGRRDVMSSDVGVDDAVVGVSASGRTPYVLAAVAQAAAAGALTVGVANNARSPLCRTTDLGIDLLTGPEVVAGSTRMKAGTAQKLVLNALSTLTMVRLGCTYGDLMVDVQAANAKLRRRAHRVVAAATGEPDDRVATALDAAGGAAKVAVVSLLTGVDAAAAARRLDAAGGRVRTAVGSAGEGERQRAGGWGSAGEGERQRAGGWGSAGEGERQRAGGWGSAGEGERQRAGGPGSGEVGHAG